MIKATTADAYNLFHRGSLALARVEANGIKIDTDYLARAIKEVSGQIDELQESLKRDPIWREWQKAFGERANLTSYPQLAEVLFKHLKYPVTMVTPTEKPSANEAHLKTVKLPFVKKYLRLTKLNKIQGTYLTGIARETDQNGFLHPSFNLASGSGDNENKGGAQSYRSSSSMVNFQNMPIRNKRQGKVIRRCFIPRKGRQLLEVDYCLVGSTGIETTSGSRPLKEVVEAMFRGESVYVFGYDPVEGRIGVSKVLKGALTRKKARVWKVVLDNGEEVIGTKDHKFMLRDGTELPLGELLPGMSLMPFYKKNKKSPWGTVYSNIYLNNGETRLAHQLVALDIFGKEIKGSRRVVHHWDGNGCNNDPSNLEVMSRAKHMKIHAKQGWERSPRSRLEWARSKENIEQLKSRNKERIATLTDEDRKLLSERMSAQIKVRGGHAGSKNPRFGKEVSQEARKKMSEAKKGKPTGRSWNRGYTKDTHPSVAKISASNLGKPKTRSKEKKQCPVCGKEFRVLRTHMTVKHGITTQEYQETYNHKVVSIEPVGREDVYNITVDKFHNYALSAGIVVSNCALEFKVIACHWHDDDLIVYASDKKKDIHRDMAADCYLLDLDGVEKPLYKDSRYNAKNKFVFPQFYGSYYIKCAPALWAAISSAKLTTPDGVPLKEHLASRGITSLGPCESGRQPKPGTYEYHIHQVEKDFWNNRFPKCARERLRWVNKYRETGGFDFLTGFRAQGIYSRNQIFNYPVQGAGFHCLLWSLIEIEDYLIKHKCETLLIGEIHDSLLLDCHPGELDALLPVIKKIMTKNIRQAWKWIIVPLEIECDVTEVDQAWHEKRSITI